MFAHSFMELFFLVQSFKASLHPLLRSPPGQPSLNLHGFGCCLTDTELWVAVGSWMLF